MTQKRYVELYNQIETLLSSLCQLRLEVDPSYHSLESYTRTQFYI